MSGLSHVEKALVVGLVLMGALALFLPEQFAMRATEMTQLPAANVPLIYGFGFALIACGVAVATETPDPQVAPGVPICSVVAGLALLSFLALTFRLETWWIDDAGITFAYSRSLSEGLGLVAQPWLPPEEGYSSSIWMLLLAGAAWLGADIPLAAKYLGIGFSATTLLICAVILIRETRSPLAVLICSIGIAIGPTVTWAASGQEHALQALILLMIVLCSYLLVNWRWPVAVLLSIFVLTRPEGPIIVIAVFVAAVYLTRRAGGRLINAADIGVALLPFLTFVGLIVFRVLYFGDPLPNPYYAKSSEAGLIGLINPLGGGWYYLLLGLRDTALFLVLTLAFLIRVHPRPTWVIIAWAVTAGHVIFVVWAKGDWMGQYRFLMPILPVAMLLAALGLRELGGVATRRIFGIVATLTLIHSTTVQLATFAAQPTTPMAAVVQVGNTIRALADRLEIDDPMLAHHDAGGIAYHRMVRLVDLGGLVNRTIGKHMDDPEFLAAYLVNELQPDFFFGERNFAAASGFSDTATFNRDYVKLHFPKQPQMSTELAYLRRSRLVDAAGVTPVFDANGTLIAVHVDLSEIATAD